MIDMGDWHDMESLCSYDRGKGDFGQRRYKEDVEVGLEARDAFCHELDRWNNARRDPGNKIDPRLVGLLGNHEDRINRALADEPQLEGVIGTDDLKHPRWEQIPYRQPEVIDGVVYCHVMPSGIMGRPIGGEHPAHSVIAKKHQSCVVAHSHLLDYCERNRADMQRIQCWVAGCYYDHPDFADVQVQQMRHPGLLILTDVVDGVFDFAWRSIGRIREQYGKLTDGG